LGAIGCIPEINLSDLERVSISRANAIVKGWQVARIDERTINSLQKIINNHKEDLAAGKKAKSS